VNLLSVENLSKWYGDKLLFKKISFGIEKGQKIALIAKNGTGKSTLLHIIMGIEPSDEGSVTLRNDIQVSYLPQITDYDEERTILDFVLNANTPLINAVKKFVESGSAAGLWIMVATRCRLLAESTTALIPSQ